jgi:hypothetical protein
MKVIKYCFLFTCCFLFQQNIFAQVPAITSFSPATVGPGDTIIINGTNFSDHCSLYSDFGGAMASQVLSPTKMLGFVDYGTQGPSNLQISYSDSNYGNYYWTTPTGGISYDATPIINSVIPLNAKSGDTITIKGKYLSPSGYGPVAPDVTFGGVAASSVITVGNTFSIVKAVVGSGASGMVAVTNIFSLTGVYYGFNYLTSTTISSFSPVSGKTGDTVRIRGTNFTGATSVSFGGVSAGYFHVDSSTRITAIVGAGASGNISITTPNGTVTKSGFTYNTCTPNSSSTFVSVCPVSLPYIWNGITCSVAGNYSKILTNSKGCDSTANLVLTVKATSVSTTNMVICSSALPFTWNGSVCTKGGTYMVHLTNSAGCDSSATLILSVRTTSTSFTNISICSSSLPYYWNGISYSVAGTYVKNLINYYGCDSIATLMLTVKNSDTYVTNVSVCTFPYLWNGSSYDSAGNYKKVLINSAGCDSTLTLHLTRVPNNWTGSVSSAWENPSNWSCGTLPDANTDVVINTGTVVLSSNTTVRSWTVNPNASLTVSPGYNLTVKH